MRTWSIPSQKMHQDDEKFLTEEKYALSKAKVEKYICEQKNIKNWTIVRPVISFSDRRFDIVTIHQNVLDYRNGAKPMYLPENVKNLTAGLDWAGNSGKLIANLLFKKEALQQAFTISSAQNLTWGEVTEIYAELLGIKFEWICAEEWLKHKEYVQNDRWAAVYDRFFDRTIDNSKVLKVTGLKKEDFKTIKEGLKIELEKCGIDVKEEDRL